LTTIVEHKKTKPLVYQVLLLENDKSDDVEVQEADQVDFFLIEQHLKNGGSVFITAKESQKLINPKTRAQENYSKSRRNYCMPFRRSQSD